MLSLLEAPPALSGCLKSVGKFMVRSKVYTEDDSESTDNFDFQNVKQYDKEKNISKKDWK